MVVDESIPTEKSLIAWKEGQTDCSLARFLEKNVPSKTLKIPGGDGWIWVRSNRADLGDTNKKPSDDSLQEAIHALQDLFQHLEDIQKDDNIPQAKSKTSGPSKRMLKDSSVRKCKQFLHEIGVKHWPTGKWIFSGREEYVDITFKRLAQSLIEGPLSKLENARCHTIKAAIVDRVITTRPEENPRHLIYLYFDNIWSKQDAAEVLECIVKEHGQIPTSAEADLYEMINQVSNHPSIIQTILYRPAELFTWEQIQDWRLAFFQAMMKEETEEQAKKSPAGLNKPDNMPTYTVSKKRKYGWEHRTSQPETADKFWLSVKQNEEVKISFSRHRREATTGNQPISSRAELLAVEDDSDTQSESESGGFIIPRPKLVESTPSVTTSDNKRNDTNAGECSEVGTPFHADDTLVFNTIPYSKGNDNYIGMSSQPNNPIRASETRLRRKDYSAAEPVASLMRARKAHESTSPKQKPKETPIVVLKPKKKRDRFGRDDF